MARQEAQEVVGPAAGSPGCPPRQKVKKRKAQRQADLDFLTQAANEYQGFALLPAEGPTKEELKAEAYLQLQADARRQLEEAIAAQRAHWDQQLKAQRKITNFFKPSTGCLPSLRAAAENALAPFRGSRGALAPACATPAELPALTDKQRNREMQRRVDLLAEKAASVKKARPAEEVPCTPEPARKRGTPRTREAPFLGAAPAASLPPPASEAATSPGEQALAPLPPEEALERAAAVLLPNTMALRTGKRGRGRPAGKKPLPAQVVGLANTSRKAAAARKATGTGRKDGPGADAKKALLAFVQSEGQRSAGQVGPK